MRVVQYCLFQETGDLFSLDDAIASERKAVAAWEGIVSAAGDVYRDDLAFGVARVGFPRHWKEELGKLRAGLESLKGLRRGARPPQSGIAHVPVRIAQPGHPLTIRATVPGAASARVMMEGRAPVAMKQSSPGMFEAEVPVTASFTYSIEASTGARTEPVKVLVTGDHDAPKVQLLAVGPARPGVDLEIAVKAQDPLGIRAVRLRYRHLTQYEDYQTEPMHSDQAGNFRARIPGAFITAERDLMYFIEAVDQAGNSCIAPDLETETPYRIVAVAR